MPTPEDQHVGVRDRFGPETTQPAGPAAITTSVGSYERPTMRLAWAAATHVGKVRSHNEDGYLAENGLFVVADGMGGHEAGEIASALALEVCREYSANVPLSLDEVRDVVAAANHRVFAYASDVGPHGMGTTLVGAAVVDNGGVESIAVFNVGDSRAYLVDPENGPRLLTHDHSVVQELVDAGRIDESEATSHPERNVVTRAIGIEPSVAGDVLVVPQTASSRLMLCSDGVSGELDLETIGRVLSECSAPSDAVSIMIDRVLSGRAPDNATVIVVDVERSDPEDSDETRDTERLPGVALVDDVPETLPAPDRPEVRT